MSKLIQVGDVWFQAKKFNCGCLAVGICNVNRYCPLHLEKALDEILEYLSAA